GPCRAAAARRRAAVGRAARGGRRALARARRSGARARVHARSTVPAPLLPGALGHPVAEAHRSRARRRGRVRARPPRGRRMILGNCTVVTMDDARTEHANGWVSIEDGVIAEVGAGAPPGPCEDLHGAVVTPGLVNTHHHLYQTLTRSRAQEADLFTW